MLRYFIPNFDDIVVIHSKDLVNQMYLREILDFSRDLSCDALAINVVFVQGMLVGVVRQSSCSSCGNFKQNTPFYSSLHHALLQMIDGMFPFVCQACQLALYERQVQCLRTQTQKEEALPHMTSLHGPVGMWQHRRRGERQQHREHLVKLYPVSLRYDHCSHRVEWWLMSSVRLTSSFLIPSSCW